MTNPFDPEHQQEATSSKLVVALSKLAESFRVMLWEQTKAFGLSPIQVQILIFLRHHSTELAKPAALADELNVTRPTISDALRALTKKGLIETKPNPADSRSRLLLLTGKAQQLTNDLQEYATPLQSAINSLNKGQQSDMLYGLIQVLNELEKAQVINPQRMCYNCAYYKGDRKQTHHCTFLERDLSKADLRIDCPDHRAA